MPKLNSDPVAAILKDHRGQCLQYAATFQAMMKYVGFDVKLVSGKNSSGRPHWWNEINCAGGTYLFDAQVGGRFMTTYEDIGVVKEKVYD